PHRCDLCSCKRGAGFSRGGTGRSRLRDHLHTRTAYRLSEPRGDGGKRDGHWYHVHVSLSRLFERRHDNGHHASCRRAASLPELRRDCSDSRLDRHRAFAIDPQVESATKKGRLVVVATQIPMWFRQGIGILRCPLGFFHYPTGYSLIKTLAVRW